MSIKEHSKISNLDLNFQVPIKQNSFFNGEFIIKGTAITSTITDTNHKFLPEELSLAAKTMQGIPLLIDHDNRVESIKGRVREGVFDAVSQSLEFEAIVMDKPIQDKIKEGLLDSVSIGATVQDIEEEDGVFVPRGIKIRELSLVAVPADENAKFKVVSNAKDFQMALTQALELANPKLIISAKAPATESFHETSNNILEKSRSPRNQGTERGLVDMEKETEITELKTQLAEQEAKIAKFEAKERKSLEESYSTLCKEKNVEAMDIKEVDNKMLGLLVQQVLSVKLADVDEKPKETTPEPKEESKEKVEEPEEDVEEAGKYKILQIADSDTLTGNAFTVEFSNPRISNYVRPN